MNTPLVILNIKKKVAEQGKISLSELGLLDSHIAEIIEHIKNDPNYEISFEGYDTIIKKKINQESDLLKSLATNIKQAATPIEKETKKKPIKPIVIKYWWSFIIPLIIGLLLLAVEKGIIKIPCFN